MNNLTKKDKYFLVFMLTWIIALAILMIVWPESSKEYGVYLNSFFVFILAIMAIVKETTNFFKEKK